ncbi:LacI family transcriptional regulator [Bifidobacterium amazonense]|uniref:LacI family transcriptional regulator n=1 Tax=Bifidobacterium amazonense TaxID=2809027 RepID=A0ABS9VUK0_9BIFI|nr:LacI family DNA-binding transcriptional regulator [Bifidobacterium amazonense]MCH9275778.1 LacI family transcriptional regulator [Bifidobacterium amazonense]
MADNTERKVTLAEIARRSGVSIAAVSKVINGRDGVSDATRQNVEKVLEQVGYRRKRQLDAKMSSTVELILPYGDGNGVIEFLRGATSQANAMGAVVTVSETKPGADRYELFLQILRRNPLGVIVNLPDVTDKERKLFRSRSIPFVIVDLNRGTSDEALSIGVDNWTGGLIAGRHLIELGHRRIAAVSGPEDSESSAARMAGLSMALREAGISIDPALVWTGDFLSEAGVDATMHFMQMSEPPTAIFGFNDLTAIGVLRAAAHLRVLVPEELSVIGFDDVFPVAGLGLTTVHQPFLDIARESVKMIMNAKAQQDEGRHIADRRIVMTPRLEVRQTTGVPRS